MTILFQADEQDFTRGASRDEKMEMRALYECLDGYSDSLGENIEFQSLYDATIQYYVLTDEELEDDEHDESADDALASCEIDDIKYYLFSY